MKLCGQSVVPSKHTGLLCMSTIVQNIAVLYFYIFGTRFVSILSNSPFLQE